MRCLRTILGVHLMDKIRNEEIRQRLNIPSTICEEIIKRRLKWFGHVLRMPHHRLPYQALQNGRRPRGRPPKRWKDQVQYDVGLSTQEAEQRARDRSDWSMISRRGARGHTVLCT